jgi:hypothetical protein
VAGAAGLAAFLDAVAVVADAFECSWAGAVAAFGDPAAADLSQDVGDGQVPVLRGESPPYLWRYGGRGAGSG